MDRNSNGKPPDPSQANKMTHLYETIDRDDYVGDNYRSRYSSYDLFNSRIESLNGTPGIDNFINYRENHYENIDCYLYLIDLGLWTP